MDKSLQNLNKPFKLILTTLLLFSISFFTFSNTKLQASKIDDCISYKDNLMLSDYLKDVKDKMQNKTGVYVLEQGIEAMLSRAWLTQHAQTSIDVQYFIFSTDNIGLIATNYLIQAAKRGVKVRVLVDDIMVEASGEDLLKIASHKNIDIKIYNPMANIGKNIFQKIINISTDFHKLNQRMHNKTFTIDGKVTITGGRNVADEYFGYDHQYNFRDRDVLLVGGITRKVQKSFNTFWESKLSIDIKDLLQNKKLDSYTPIFTELHKYACNPENFVPSVRDKIKEIPSAIKEIQEEEKIQWIENVEYISDIPGKNNANKFLAGGGETTDRLISLLKNSKESVIIQTPYLITTKKTRKILKELVSKDIDIKILTNSLASTDNLEAFNGYQRDRQALLKTGVEIYEFKPDAKIRQKIMSEVMQKKLIKAPIFGLHAKSMVIDNKISVIGTYNIDPRSANLNTENLVIIPSKKIAKEIKEGMIEEMKEENAWKISLDWNPDSLVDLKKRIRVKIRRIVPKSIL